MLLRESVPERQKILVIEDASFYCDRRLEANSEMAVDDRLKTSSKDLHLIWYALKAFPLILLISNSPDDVVIAVIGTTGVGKSTFIADCTREQTPTIGHGMSSCKSLLYGL